MAEPKYMPSWVFWKILIPVMAFVIAGGVSFVAWATPKIVAVEERDEYIIKTQDRILDKVSEIEKTLREYGNDRRK